MTRERYSAFGLLICAAFALAARAGPVSPEAQQAIQRATQMPAVAETLAGVRKWRAQVVHPSESTNGLWIVRIHVPGQEQPYITARVRPGSGKVVGVLWDGDTLSLRRRTPVRIRTPRDLRAVKTESLRTIKRAVGAHPLILEHLRKYKDAKLQIEYAPDAECWIIFIHEAGRPLGFATYARGAMRDVFIAGVNWDPSTVKDPPPAFDLSVLVPALGGPTGVWVMLIAGLLLVMRRRGKGETWLFLALWAMFAARFLPWCAPKLQNALTMACLIVLFILLVRERRPAPGDDDGPILAERALKILVAALVVAGILMMPISEPTDSAVCSGIGARYVLAEGTLPYGAEISSVSWVARDRNTYGPLLYLVNAPAEAAAPTTYLSEGIRRCVGDDGWSSHFDRKTMTRGAAVATGLFFHVLSLAGIGLLGWRAGGLRTALMWVGLAALGMRFVAPGADGHIVPMAMVIWAIVCVDRPLAAGVFLGLGASAMFYPAFAVPLWLGWYRRRSGMPKFVIGLACVALVMLVLIVLMSRVSGPVEAVKVFVKDTVLMQEGAEGYGGATKYGFWPAFPALRNGLQKPVMIAFLVLCVALAFRPAVMRPERLVGLTAAVFIATQFWKTHGPGYFDWYYHLAFMALFWPGMRADATRGDTASQTRGGQAP